MTRFFLSVGKDINKLKMGLAFLLTTRGIPEIYYGTELMMDGDGAYHPDIRKDFPGGWPGDPVNAFTSSGRTPEQNGVHDYMKKLLTWRKTQPVIHKGKLTHYIPADNIYVYFRHDLNKSVMVVLNANNSKKEVKTERFTENMKSFSGGKEILSGTDVRDLSAFELMPWEVRIIELR